MNIKSLAAAAVLAAAAMVGSASAATLNSSVTTTGKFNLKIYNFDAGGSAANAAATVANVDAQASAGKLVFNGTYTGNLDFFLDTPGGAPTIAEFLATSGGSYVGFSNANFNNLILSEGAGSSSPVFRTTTFFDFTAEITDGLYGTVTHDDGISVLDDGVTVASSAPPTTVKDTDYAFNGGAFRLIYAAANGDPSVLKVAAVPLPATLFLMLGALGGLGAMSRRRRVAA
ncbi:VPLPA-CTERM sorting domain-containing protein [Pikeienuella sp. HZG-20]|uniref:VPLPA-CTERM sorting domain-containing protein n=1 Tax=Paludibacillus litoralis TaxID=3133267 RepID=UPI0030EB42A7